MVEEIVAVAQSRATACWRGNIIDSTEEDIAPAAWSVAVAIIGNERHWESGGGRLPSAASVGRGSGCCGSPHPNCDGQSRYVGGHVADTEGESATLLASDAMEETDASPALPPSPVGLAQLAPFPAPWRGRETPPCGPIAHRMHIITGGSSPDDPPSTKYERQGQRYTEASSKQSVMTELLPCVRLGSDRPWCPGRLRRRSRQRSIDEGVDLKARTSCLLAYWLAC